MENRATVNKPFADYLKDFDPEEKYLHVEPSEHKPNELFYVYPIQAWRESVIRLQRQKQVSETSRAIRHALAEEEQTIKNKIQRRRDILSECVADALRGELRRIAQAASDDADALAAIGAQLNDVADELAGALSGEELDRRTHAVRSAADYACKLVGDVHRLAGRLETLAAIRRVQATAADDA